MQVSQLAICSILLLLYTYWTPISFHLSDVSIVVACCHLLYSAYELRGLCHKIDPLQQCCGQPATLWIVIIHVISQCICRWLHDMTAWDNCTNSLTLAWQFLCSMTRFVFYAGLLLLLPDSVSTLGFLYMLSYIKVIVTASKYVPQALLNYRR